MITDICKNQKELMESTFALYELILQGIYIWHKVGQKDVFACLFSVHNTISLSSHEKLWLIRLRLQRYFSHHRPKRSQTKHTCSWLDKPVVLAQGYFGKLINFKHFTRICFSLCCIVFFIYFAHCFFFSFICSL